MAFSDALRVLNAMKADGVIEEYALAGAMAVVRWTEARGFVAEEEHILIAGLPTQFVPSPGPLAREAIDTAVEMDYEGVPVRVTRPEYLIALYLLPEARTARRRERAAMLMDLPHLDRALVGEILERYGLSL